MIKVHNTITDYITVKTPDNETLTLQPLIFFYYYPNLYKKIIFYI